jgi:hypothetical protein
MVPLSHGSSVSGKCGLVPSPPGNEIDAMLEDGHAVWLPVGTSENWYVNSSFEVGDKVTDFGVPLASDEMSTLSPSITVTGIDAPLLEYRAMVG